MKKSKSYLILLLSIAIIFGLNIIYDFKKPSCVEAQTCYRISPQVSYFGSPFYSSASVPAWIKTQRCTTRTVTSPYVFTNISMPVVVALTGWHLSLNRSPYSGGGADDHHWRRGKIRIQESTISIRTNVRGLQAVRFNVTLCMHDRNSDDFHEGSARFIAYAWN